MNTFKNQVHNSDDADFLLFLSKMEELEIDVTDDDKSFMRRILSINTLKSPILYWGLTIIIDCSLLAYVSSPRTQLVQVKLTTNDTVNLFTGSACINWFACMILGMKKENSIERKHDA